MTHAYDKLYLGVAQRNLARMLDYLVNVARYSLSNAWDMFLTSSVCDRFEQGDCSILAGFSGIELAYEVLSESKKSISHKDIPCEIEKSKEYWTGWAIAYYQWKIGVRFKEITDIASITEICHMYHPYHEMDIEHFVDKMNEIYWDKKPITKLKKYRNIAGLSQSELSKLTNVPVRTIQQYEQRQKDINKAQAETLLRFSKSLKCNMEELIERIPCKKQF